jgi:hypothetical protein
MYKGDGFEKECPTDPVQPTTLRVQPSSRETYAKNIVEKRFLGYPQKKDEQERLFLVFCHKQQ